MTYWITMHDKSSNGYSGVYVIKNQKYVQPAASIKRGDRVAVFVGRKKYGPSAVIALVEVTKRLNMEVGKDKKGRMWVQVANTVTITEEGSCSLDELLKILEPNRKFKNNNSKGAYLAGRCACTVSQIKPEEFDEIGNYFPDYESNLKTLQKVSAGAFENDELPPEQGFASGEERKIIEDYAMVKAKEWLKNNGFRNIKNRSRSNSYDLSCTLKGSACYVEVKGTRSDGASVIITQGEKCYAENNNNVILFVLRKIKLEPNEKGGKKACGGAELVFRPWDITEGRVTPISYRYALPLTH